MQTLTELFNEAKQATAVYQAAKDAKRAAEDESIEVRKPLILAEKDASKVYYKACNRMQTELERLQSEMDIDEVKRMYAETEVK